LTLKYLLDTSIVSAAVSKVPNLDVIRRLEAHGTDCAIASVVWHELLFGCSRLAPSHRRSFLEAYIRDVVRPSFPILPYDEDAARWHAIERARLEAAGKTAPFADGQIASIAFSNELILVTANPKDFRSFAGLEVQDWTRKRRSD
jgi:tRNA(fMet)-specific endonuclease VapC